MDHLLCMKSIELHQIKAETMLEICHNPGLFSNSSFPIMPDDRLYLTLKEAPDYVFAELIIQDILIKKTWKSLIKPSKNQLCLTTYVSRIIHFPLKNTRRFRKTGIHILGDINAYRV